MRRAGQRAACVSPIGTAGFDPKESEAAQPATPHPLPERSDGEEPVQLDPRITLVALAFALLGSYMGALVRRAASGIAGAP